MLGESKILIYRDQEELSYFKIWETFLEINTRISYMINRNIVWLSTEEIK